MKNIRVSVARNAVLIGICSLLVVPLYIVFVNAFKPDADIRADPLSIPLDRMSLQNLTRALNSTEVDLVAAYVRTLGITVASVALLVLMASMLGYALARISGRSGNGLYLFFAFGMFIPGLVVLLPTIKVFQVTGLLFTPQGMVLYNVATAIPFATLLFAAYIRTIPRELDEAAIVDGATRFQIYRHVILPLTVPAIATVSIFAGIGFWSDFIGPNVILSPSGAYTVTTGVVRAVGRFAVDYELLFGWLFIVIAPILLFFVVMQRFFVSGLAAGAVKK